MDLINLCHEKLKSINFKASGRMFNRYDLDFWDTNEEDIYAYVIVNYMYSQGLDKLLDYKLVMESEDEDGSIRTYRLYNVKY